MLRRRRRAGALAALALVLASLGTPAAQGTAHAQTLEAEVRARHANRPLRRPLLRVARSQFCLKELGYYEGAYTREPNGALYRAFRSYRADRNRRPREKVTHDSVLHELLWRECRDRWSSLVAGRAPAPPIETATIRQPPRDATVASAAPLPAAPAPAAAPPGAGARACLPADLKELVEKHAGRRRDIEACELPCIPRPGRIGQDEAAQIERRHGLKWCRSCVPYSGSLTIEDATRIEQAGGVTLCPQVRLPLEPAPRVPSQTTTEPLRGVRALFQRGARPLPRHPHFAVIVASRAGIAGHPERVCAERDGAAMQALLTERLGYRPERVIELVDPTRADIERVLGKAEEPRGLLAERMRESPGADVLVYVSGHGVLAAGGGEAQLVVPAAARAPGTAAAAAAARRESAAIPLARLYRNLAALGAGHVTVVLEAEFRERSAAPLAAPNLPESDTSPLPRSAGGGMTVMTAGERDQGALIDPEHCLGLFTRHLIEGLSGAADQAPAGNGDGAIDTLEAFVFAAHRVAVASRKTLGLLQRPAISLARPTPLVRAGR